jgi:hypothetical protein
MLCTTQDLFEMKLALYFAIGISSESMAHKYEIAFKSGFLSCTAFCAIIKFFIYSRAAQDVSCCSAKFFAFCHFANQTNSISFADNIIDLSLMSLE